MSLRHELTGRLSSVLLGCAVLAGCATTAGTRPPLPAGSCPTAGVARDGGTIIDWAAFVVVGDVMFHTVYTPDSVLIDTQVGAVVSTVTCRIADAIDDPDFRPRNGDAAYLPAGTRLHAVVGAPPTVQLAAREDGVWRRYKADPAVPTPTG